MVGIISRFSNHHTTLISIHNQLITPTHKQQIECQKLNKNRVKIVICINNLRAGIIIPEKSPLHAMFSTPIIHPEAHDKFSLFLCIPLSPSNWRMPSAPKKEKKKKKTFLSCPPPRFVNSPSSSSRSQNVTCSKEKKKIIIIKNLTRLSPVPF